MAGSSVLRFLIIGDDRGGSAFDRFTRSVDRSNTAVARSEAALRRQEQQQDKASGSLARLTGSVTGFSDVSVTASGKASILERAIAGINVATGIAEPLLAGAIVTAGGLAAGYASAAAGAIAYKVALTPLLAQVKTVTTAQAKLAASRQQAQLQYQAALAAGASPAAAAAARTTALTKAQMAYTQAVKGTPPAVRAFSRDLKNTQDQYKSWANRLAQPVLDPLDQGLKLVRPGLRALRPLVLQASGAFGTLESQLARAVKGGGLSRIVGDLGPHVMPTILALGHSIGNVSVGIYGIIKAFLPVSDKISSGVEHLTLLFRKWAESLPSHSGFQSLMATFTSSTPLAVNLLKNLVVVIRNVATATTGLASPANSKALLQILTPLSQIMVRLTANQGLVRAVLYFMLLRSSLNQVSGAFRQVKSGVDVFSKVFTGAQKAYGVAGRLAGGFRDAQVAESAFSGTAGTLGGKLRTVWTAVSSTTGAVLKSTGAWIANAASLVAGKVAMAAVWTWQKLVTAAQWLWNAAMDANPIGAVVLALTALAGGLVYAWTHFAGFRKVVEGVWTWIKTHWPLLLTIITGPIGLAVVYIVKHWSGITSGAAAVLSWMRSHWPLLLAILTGPVGLATLAIVRNWHTITGAVSAAFGWIKSHWPLLLAILTGPIGLLVLYVAKHFDQLKTEVSSVMRSVELFFLRMIDGMLGGLKDLVSFMGHLPGPLGAPFRAAAGEIDKLKGHVDSLITKLSQVHSKNVQLTVNADGHYFVAAGGGKFITNQWTGGAVRGPGGPTDDKAGLYALSDREWVIRAHSATKYGDKAMAAVNRGDATILHRGMATGGKISGGYSGTPQGLGAFDAREYAATVKLVEDLTAKGAKKAMMGAGWGRGAGRKLVSLLRPYVGRVPYVWGGTSPSGWDCSGMTFWGLKHANGISAPRTSEAQYAWVRRTNDQVGALAFFVSPAGGAPPGHVGVSMGNGSMINAAGTLSGTTISGTGGAMGFGVPPGAVGMAAGGKAGKAHPDPQRKRWLAQLARDVKVLEAARKAAARRRKILRHSVEIDQLWFLTHPGVRKGGIGWNEHQRALRNDSRRLRLFNKRETARETLLSRKIALLRDLTGFPRGIKYGGPGAPGPDPGTGDGGGVDGGGDTGGGTTTSGPPPIPPPPMPAWMVAAGLGPGGAAPAGMTAAGIAPWWAMQAGRPGYFGTPFRSPVTDPIAGRWAGPQPAPPLPGGGVPGSGGAAEVISELRMLRQQMVTATRGVAPGVAAGVDQSINGMTSRVAARVR